MACVSGDKLLLPYNLNGYGNWRFTVSVQGYNQNYNFNCNSV